MDVICNLFAFHISYTGIDTTDLEIVLCYKIISNNIYNLMMMMMNKILKSQVFYVIMLYGLVHEYQRFRVRPVVPTTDIKSQDLISQYTVNFISTAVRTSLHSAYKISSPSSQMRQDDTWTCCK
jgi:hypothetical protein